MTRGEFLENLGEFLSMPIDATSAEVVLTDGTWDSLAILSLVGLAAETWGVEITAEKLAECTTVGQVTRLFDDYFAG